MTVTLAIFLSAFVSLTLTPMMCVRFLTHASGNPGRMSRWLESGFDRVLGVYDRGLVWVLRHRFFMLLVTLSLIVATVFLYVTIPKGFFPEQDTGFIFGEAQARHDISFVSMARIENQFAAIILRNPVVAGWWDLPCDGRQPRRKHRPHVHTAQTLRRAAVGAGGHRETQTRGRRGDRR